MSVEHGEAAPSGLSRRQLLTRGAIAGGLVWAAPVIRTTAAYATTANGTESPCTNFFMVVINPAGQARPAPPNHDDHSIPPAIRQWFSDNPDVTVQFPQVPPLLTQNDGQLWAVLMPEVTGPNAAGRQCRMVLGWARKGQNFAEGYIDPNPQLAVEVGRRLLFPCPDQGHSNNNDTSSADAVAPTDTSNTTTTTTTTTTTDAVSGSSTTTSTTAPTAVGSQITSDGGSSSNTISGDGTPSTSESSDGHPSTGNTGPGKCIDAIYLVYCCPQ